MSVQRCNHGWSLAALLAFSAGAGAQENDRAALADLVDRMRGAILSGHSAAYLADVDLREEPFATEHRRFVADWAKRPPKELALNLEDVRIEGDTARGALNWAWRTAEGSARRAEFAATFTKQSGRWRYEGERFTKVGTPGVNVFAQPGQEDAARTLAAQLPEVYAQVTRTLNFSPTQKPAVKLYASPASLSASVQLNLQPVAGWNEPGEAIKLTVTSKNVRGTLAHELAHFVVFARLRDGQRRLPWWLHEGVAQFVAAETWAPSERAAVLNRVASWARGGKLAAWPDLADFARTPDALWPNVYAQGYAFARFAVETRGMGALNVFMDALAGGADIQAASEQSLGGSFEAVNAAFERWLGEQASQ